MKRTLCLFLALIISLSLCACSIELAVLASPAQQQLINKYFRAFEKDDPEAILDLFYEPIVEQETKATKLNRTRYLKDVDKFYGRYGDDVTKKKITKISPFNEDLLDSYNNIYFDESLFGLKISEGCEITVSVTNSEDSEYTMRFNCFKILGKWYIYSVIK